MRDARVWEPGAKSRESGAGRWELAAGSWVLDRRTVAPGLELRGQPGTADLPVADLFADRLDRLLQP